MASPRFGYWFVKYAPHYGTLVRLPHGQRPIEAQWGDAVFVGNTVSSADQHLVAAARKLGLPNPTKEPSLADTLGVAGSLLAGFGAGSAGAAAAGADAAGGATAEGATAGGAAGYATSAGKTLAKDALKSSAKGAAAFSLWESLKNPAVWWRITEGVIGLVLGFMALKQFTTVASGSQAVVGPSIPRLP